MWEIFSEDDVKKLGDFKKTEELLRSPEGIYLNSLIRSSVGRSKLKYEILNETLPPSSEYEKHWNEIQDHLKKHGEQVSLNALKAFGGSR